MTELLTTTPIAQRRSVRGLKKRVLTSFDAGKIIPLSYEWLHREDAVQSGRVRINVQSEMFADGMPMNGIAVNVYAHAVSQACYERFGGSIDEVNKSYAKENGAAGTVIPFFESNKYYHHALDQVNSISEAYGSNMDLETDPNVATGTFFQTMGIHTQSSLNNTTVVEAYNAIVNHRRKARSKSLPLRNAFDHSLAEAFWLNTGYNDIVADFDAKLLDGEVSLQGLTFQAPVKAPKYSRDHMTGTATSNDTTTETLGYSPAMSGADIIDEGDMYLFDEIYAELSTGGNATMSLADLDQARKTVAYAKLRSKYDWIEDEYVINLLMQGITIPSLLQTQPILIGKKSTMLNFNERFATDGANLDTKVANGSATIDMNISTPRMPYGAVIMYTMEVVPEQLWERSKDPFLYTIDTDTLPNSLRDTLDPQKVQIAKADTLDVNHNTPNATFGYQPLNNQWKMDCVRVGGKFYRPANDAFTEDRQKLWGCETLNPTLSESHYLVKDLHKKIFADQVADSFTATVMSDLKVSGNTVFGTSLLEADASSDYDTITSQVDSSRIA
jgi:hypothetical protein